MKPSSLLPHLAFCFWGWGLLSAVLMARASDSVAATTSPMTQGPTSLPEIFLPRETILFQGDSITDGNRGRSLDPNHILGHGYVFSIATRYGANFPALNLTFLNRGISGNTSEDLLARWKADTLDLKPDVLSVLIGINDIGQAINQHRKFSPEAVYATYDKILGSTKAALPNIKLILCDPFVLDVGGVKALPGPWHEGVLAMAGVVKRLSEKYHAPVAHFQEAFNLAVERAPADHWIWDGIHPTYAGHEVMTQEWIRAYNEFYVSPLRDPARNSAISPEVNFERDSYDWLHRHADVLDTQAKVNPDVVLVGDSITHFWSGEPKDQRANGPESWKKTFGEVKVLNMGFGWDRTQNVLWRLQFGELQGISPKTIVLNIGTNNLVGDHTARENSPEEVAVGIETIVDELRVRTPRSRIFVMGVFPRGFEKGNLLDRRIQKLNSILEKALVNRVNVRFLDIGSRLRSPDGSLSPKIFFDGTHPTERGYAIWGQALEEAGALPTQK